MRMIEDICAEKSDFYSLGGCVTDDRKDFVFVGKPGTQIQSSRSLGGHQDIHSPTCENMQ